MSTADTEQRIRTVENDIKIMTKEVSASVSDMKDSMSEINVNVELMKKDIAHIPGREETEKMIMSKISSAQKDCKLERTATGWEKYKPLVAYAVTALVTALGTLLGTGTIPIG